jgi:hypothetical protein
MSESLIKEILQELGPDYTFSCSLEINQAYITVTKKEDETITQTTALPLDRHLKDERILQVVGWSVDKLNGH